MLRKMLSSAMALLLSTALAAQQVNDGLPGAASTTQLSAPAQGKDVTAKIVRIPKRTSLAVHPLADLSSAALTPGQIVVFALDKDLFIDKELAIPAGSLFTGSVRTVQKKDDRHNGKIIVSDLQLNLANGRELILSGGDLEKEQDSLPWYKIAGLVLIAPVLVAVFVVVCVLLYPFLAVLFLSNIPSHSSTSDNRSPAPPLAKHREAHLSRTQLFRTYMKNAALVRSDDFAARRQNDPAQLSADPLSVHP